MPLKLETAIYDYLAADPGVFSLVGNDDDTARIYPVRMPEGTILPAISWLRASATRLYTYDVFEETDAFVTARLSFNCWSINPTEAMQIGEAVMLALSGYGGDMGGQLIGASFAVMEQDTYEAETKLYRRTLDFKIMYEDDLTLSS